MHRSPRVNQCHQFEEDAISGAATGRAKSGSLNCSRELDEQEKNNCAREK
jgi:hypothetical protein